MWPSMETATRLHDIANTILIVSLVFGVVSTAIVVWMGNVKEEYLKRDLAETNERTAKAEQKTAEAQLQLEKLRNQVRPRHITQAQQQSIAEKLKEFKGYIVSLGVKPSTNETEWLVRWIAAPFSMAGWKVEIHSGDAAQNKYVPDGILVMSTRHPRSIAAAAIVTEAFITEGLTTSTAPLLDMESSQYASSDPRSFRLLVVVGDKPVIPLIEANSH